MPANTTTQSGQSLTRDLLALPDINSRGVVHTVVFAALPHAAQQAIKASENEDERAALTCEAGDREPLIRQMHHDLVEMPAKRRAQGLVFPTIDNLADSFLRTMVKDEDREWMVREGKIQSISPEQRTDSWMVRVAYTDGTARTVSEKEAPLDEQGAKTLAERIAQTATLFGMLD